MKKPMSPTATDTAASTGKSAVTRVARLIRSDIQSKNLRSGDRYLTTEEVAELMNVAKGTANRAMQQLARDNFLVRTRKLGTYIGDAVSSDTDSADTVCLVIRRAYYLDGRERINEMLGGVLSVMGQASVQISLAPDMQEVVFAERVVQAHRDTSARVGYLVASKSSEVQAFFSEHNLPTLVMGTPFPQGERLPSIDLDQAKIGSLAVRAAVDAGRRRITVLLRDRRGFGDDVMLNAITAEAMKAGLGAGDLTVRSLPSDQKLAASTVAHLLKEDPSPEAIICRSRGPLNAAISAIQDGKLESRCVVISTDALPDTLRNDVFAGVKPAVNAFDQGVRMGEILNTIVSGGSPDPLHSVLDVSFDGIEDKSRAAG